MAISSRKAGAIVECATCGEMTIVPMQDAFSEKPENNDDAPDPSVPLIAAPIPPIPLPIPVETWIDESPAEEPGPLEETVRADSVALHAEEPFIPMDVESDEEDQEGPLTIRSRRSGDEEMDLTPMVDVTFQLLIFFMVSASFSLQKSIEVPTPDPDQKGATQQVQTLEDLQGTSILVKIDGSDTIWIDDEQLADSQRLVDTLRDKMRREQKTELLVTAHAQSRHRTIIAVIDAANEIGVQKIRMSSHKKTE